MNSPHKNETAISGVEVHQPTSSLLEEHRPDAEAAFASNSRFKFDIQAQSVDEFRSLMYMVMNRLTELRVKQSNFLYDIKLHTGLGGQIKIAKLEINTGEHQYAVEKKSSRWDNAFLNAFDEFCHKMTQDQFKK